MDAGRFDTLAKGLAGSLTRRAALGAGLAGAIAPLGMRRAVAQDATPAATPVPTTGQEFLFVQTAEAGRWEPKPGESGTYLLTLTGAASQTIYFSDRPERIVGTVPVDQFLDVLGFTPANPPNAALVTGHGDDEEVLVIELLAPAYDPGTDTLTYEARVLEDYQEEGLAFVAARQADIDLPESFGETSLFIDDCPDSDFWCFRTCLDAPGTVYGVGTCWSYFPPGCFPCDAQLCNETFPECDDACQMMTSEQVYNECNNPG